MPTVDPTGQLRLCEVRSCLCSVVWKVNHSGCGGNKSPLRSNHYPKQRLVLPLVENTDHGSQLFFFFIPFIVCSIVVVLLAKKEEEKKKRTHIVSSLEKVLSLVGSQFLGFLNILDQIVPLLHSLVSIFIWYCLSCVVMLTHVQFRGVPPRSQLFTLTDMFWF